MVLLDFFSLEFKTSLDLEVTRFAAENDLVVLLVVVGVEVIIVLGVVSLSRVVVRVDNLWRLRDLWSSRASLVLVAACSVAVYLSTTTTWELVVWCTTHHAHLLSITFRNSVSLVAAICSSSVLFLVPANYLSSRQRVTHERGQAKKQRSRIQKQKGTEETMAWSTSTSVVQSACPMMHASLWWDDYVWALSFYSPY